MLREYRAVAVSYDNATDEARVKLEAPGPESREVAGLLLIDAAGFLVGVDLGGEGLARAVVLVGPFENVDRTVATDVLVAYTPGGDPAEIRVRRARSAMRGDQPSPYLT